MAGEQPGVGEGDKSAEATAEHYRPGQSERVAEPPQIIGPGRQVPEFGGAVVTAAMTALVVEDGLVMIGEWGQRRLQVDVVEPLPGVQRRPGRPVRNPVAPR